MDGRSGPHPGAAWPLVRTLRVLPEAEEELAPDDVLSVKNRASSVLSKLGVRDRTRAVLKALELGRLARK